MSAAVRQYMTPHPYTIGLNATMEQAHVLMRNHHLRHLPVLDGGQLVGIVTERDLHLIETLKGTNPHEVPVEEAMSPDPWTVGPDTPIAEVAKEMVEHRYGAALVVEHGKVVGIFTTVDALRALMR